MAEEIKIRDFLQVINGDYKATFSPAQLTIDQATLGADSGIVEIATSEENLVITDITNEGWLILHNLDPNNFFTFGPFHSPTGLMTPFGKLKPAEHCRLRLTPGATVTLKADTAPVKVFFLLLED